MQVVYYVSRFLCWCWCKVWFRISVEGQANIPTDGPLIFAANHASHLDPVLMGIVAKRRVRYVARSSLNRIPLVGLWMRAVGTIFIDRKAPGREAIGRVVEELRLGEAIGYFPEGTRTRDGELQDFQRGLLLLLKKTGAAVVPIGIRGSFAALPPGKLFPRPRRCSVHFGPQIAAEEILAPSGLTALRRRVAELCGITLASD